MSTPVLYALVMSLVATTTITTVAEADAACPGDPSLSIADACNKTSSWKGDQNRKRAIQICMETLRGTPESSTASAYGIVATKAALDSCAATGRTAMKLSQDLKLPEIVRATYNSCVDMYDYARSNINDMGDMLKTCSPVGFGLACKGANAAVNECVDKLQHVDSDMRLPLHNMVLADRDRIILACFLGTLIPL